MTKISSLILIQVKKDRKATPRGGGKAAKSKKKDGTRLINNLIKALHPDSIVVVNDEELEAVSALFLVGCDRRQSAAFVNVPPDLAHIKEIDFVARALLRTFVYQFFFLTASHAFLSLYTLLVDDDIPGASKIQKGLSQKAFYDWSNWTTAAKKRTIKRESRVLNSSFRWQDTFTAERIAFLHGMLLNLEKPSPAIFFDSLSFCYGGHYSNNGGIMNAFFINIFGEQHPCEYSKSSTRDYYNRVRAGKQQF